MRTFLAHWLTRLAGWLQSRTASTPAAPPPGWTARYLPIDAYRRLREPTPLELLLELKNTAYTCVTLNASVCAEAAPGRPRWSSRAVCGGFGRGPGSLSAAN